MSKRLSHYIGGELAAGAGEELSLNPSNTNDVVASTPVGGVEVTIWKWIIAGAEGQYRAVNNALGEGGVSEVFNEKSLGGPVLRVLIGVRK